MGRITRMSLALLTVLALATGGCAARREVKSGADATTSVPSATPTRARHVADTGTSAGVGYSYGGTEVGASKTAADGGSTTAASEAAASDRLVIRDKTLRLRVAHADAAARDARALAMRFGGTVEQLRLASDDEAIYLDASKDANVPLGGYVTIRVPVARYESAVAAAARLGTLVAESQSADDVTQQHVDMSARLRNLQAEEATLRSMFAKARSVTEMLKVESQLSRVRGEAESLRAQIEYLERQAAMATITLELVEPTPIAQSSAGFGFHEALARAVEAAAATINAIVVFLGGAGPLVLLALLVALPVRAVVRRRRRRPSVTATATDAS